MLYFMTDGRQLKIGVTNNPKARLGAVQTGNPEPCSYLLLMELNNAMEIERLLHERLAFCVGPSDKEWFDIFYDAALTHPFALRNEWNVPCGRELPLASPQGPRLADHAVEFESWLREVWFRDRATPPGVTLEDLWSNLHQSFLKGERPVSDAEATAHIKKIIAALTPL